MMNNDNKHKVMAATNKPSAIFMEILKDAPSEEIMELPCNSPLRAKIHRWYVRG
jgi:hypothetical protein